MNNTPAVLGVMLAIGICVLLPICGIVAYAIVEGRKAKLRHQERLAMIERGLVPQDGPPTPPPVPGETPAPTYQYARRDHDVARGMGWAVGLLVAGSLWMFGDFNFFGVVFLACGAGYLTRGIVGLSRDGDGPTGGIR